MKTMHDFKSICYDVNELFDGVNSISKFMYRIEKQSIRHPERWSPEEYKGKALEALIEVFILGSNFDKRINIIDYKPILKQDYGIDGIGRSHDGSPHTIQVKYRSNSVKSLTANEDHISNFVAKSNSDYIDEMIKTGKKVQMTIFTTAKDLNMKVNENMYGGVVRVIGYKQLDNLTRDVTPFWECFKSTLINN